MGGSRGAGQEGQSLASPGLGSRLELGDSRSGFFKPILGICFLRALAHSFIQQTCTEHLLCARCCVKHWEHIRDKRDEIPDILALHTFDICSSVASFAQNIQVVRFTQHICCPVYVLIDFFLRAV